MTPRVKFVKGATQSEFLNLLGVQYGVLIAKEDESPIIIDLESAKQQLRDCETEGIFTSKEVQAIEKAMVEAELESNADMFDKARQFPIPDNYSPLFHFKVCSNPSCKRALIHGSIYGSDGQLVSLGRQSDDTIDTLEMGFSICEYVARNGGENKLDAVTLFQQMLAADLAFDDNDLLRRLLSLPDENGTKNN